jgi:hypothetical protein
VGLGVAARCWRRLELDGSPPALCAVIDPKANLLTPAQPTGAGGRRGDAGGGAAGAAGCPLCGHRFPWAVRLVGRSVIFPDAERRRPAEPRLCHLKTPIGRSAADRPVGLRNRSDDFRELLEEYIGLPTASMGWPSRRGQQLVGDRGHLDRPTGRPLLPPSHHPGLSPAAGCERPSTGSRRAPPRSWG